MVESAFISSVLKEQLFSLFRYIHIVLPKGSIKKLIGHKLTWVDEPVELDDYEFQDI